MPEQADEDCGRILDEEMARGPFRAVLHCYTGGRELAMKAIAHGLHISFTGILTFKASQALRDLDLRVENGVFGADMAVSLLNDGPVTIWLDTEAR